MPTVSVSCWEADRIGDAFEHRREPGWLQSAKAVRQGAKVRIVRYVAVEIIELYTEAEQSAAAWR